MNLLAPLTTTRKASAGAVAGGLLASIPGLQQMLDAGGLLGSIWFAKLLLLVGLPPDKVPDSTDFWKWLLAALIVHQAVYWFPNAPPPPPAQESNDHA